MKTELEKLKSQLAKVEQKLDKCRTSTIQDGWQTQKFAKKSRKWDYYAQEKMKLIQKIEEHESKIN
jgi:hypothetical protein